MKTKREICEIDGKQYQRCTSWFSFEYELMEIWNMAIPDIRRWDKEVEYIIVDDVFDVFFLSDGRIVTL